MHQKSSDDLHLLRRDLLSSLQSHHQLVDRYKFWLKSSSHDRAHERDLLQTISNNIDALRRHATPLATSYHILDSLYFEQMHTRHSTIKASYADTFAWIFDDVETHFKSWLEHDAGIFWVRGKAGSGKSTLMKFLGDHHLTPSILQRWAGTKKLLTASFYFWNAGSPMEKSQEGLLQSILFQILSQCPNLIPLVTPDRWQGDNAYHKQHRPWNHKELSDALKIALSDRVLPARFCFFIDGLDEFAGDYADLTRASNSPDPRPDHHDLLAVLDSLATTNDVKICVSSRPWNPFRNAFGNDEHRMFILEDLTKKDMDIYVQGMLEHDSRYRRLVGDDPRAHQIVSEVRQKAQGVFLWVYLAVRSLLRGLSEGDTVEELLKRLRSLPSDLKEFFHRILASIDEEYRPLTCRTLVMTTFAESRLPLLAFWFLRLELDCPEYAIQAKIEPLGPAATKLRSSAASSINKWCRDLLEVEMGEEGLDEDLRLLDGSICFLHRTVRDFLSDLDVSSYLSSHVGGDFDMRKSFMRIYLAQAKLLPSHGLPNDSRSLGIRFSNCMRNVMSMAKELELQGSGPATTMLKELDSVGRHHFHGEGSHWVDRVPVWSSSGDHDELRIRDQGSANFLSHAVCHNLIQFVQRELAEHPQTIHKEGRPLLTYVLHPTSRPAGFAPEHAEDAISSEMLELLLNAGADPNEHSRLSDSHTIWQIFLYECYHGRPGDLRSPALTFLKHRAEFPCKIAIVMPKTSLAPVMNLTGSRHTRVDPSRGTLVEKEFATVNECLSQHLTAGEIGDASSRWRSGAAFATAAGAPEQRLRGWLTWLTW